jgi:2-haloacid dehalogenase
MIKNIIFDFGNVFIEWNPRRIFQKIVAAGVLENVMQNVWNEEWNNNLDRGVPFIENERNLKEKYPQHSRYITAFHARWHESLGEVNKETVALLARLQRAGYATYGLSNWSAETFPVTRNAHPFFNTFNGIVISGEEKVCKPAPEIYEILLDRYRLLPGQCVFIDDRQENLDTASRLGVATILFTNAKQVEDDLKRMGIFKKTTACSGLASP